jgi:hypothetical protein
LHPILARKEIKKEDEITRDANQLLVGSARCADLDAAETEQQIRLPALRAAASLLGDGLKPDLRPITSLRPWNFPG